MVHRLHLAPSIQYGLRRGLGEAGEVDNERWEREEGIDAAQELNAVLLRDAVDQVGVHDRANGHGLRGVEAGLGEPGLEA